MTLAFSQLINKTSLIIHVIKNIEPNTTALVIKRSQPMLNQIK